MPDTQTNEDVKRRADEQRQADDKRRAEAEQKADERRKETHEADEKRRAEEFEAKEAKLAEARKRAEAWRKEQERRAGLSASERAAEDQKRAEMTPEERAKEDEEKGAPTPEQQDQINALAGTPQYPVITESVPHATGFVLSEANGQLSRENGNFAGPVTVTVGMPVVISSPAVGLVPATYIPVVTGGTACDGLSLYGAVIAAGTSQYLSVLARNAEVNSKAINWGALVAADQTAIKTALAKVGVIFR